VAAAQGVAAGVLALEGRRLIEVSGADRVDYLHRMLTQDVQGLAPGRGAAACYLTATGRVLAHMLVWRSSAASGDRLWLDVAAGASPEALPALERYVIADDVVFREVDAAYASLLLVAPDAGLVLAAAGVQALTAPGHIVELEVEASDRAGGARGFALPLGFGARQALYVRIPAHAAPRLLDRLVAAGAAPWSADDLDRARVAEGVPWPGVEIDDRILPNEARLDDAVSFQKGCFPGQEPVIMARHRGHPSTLLVRLLLAAAPEARAGTALLDGARQVGRLTTVAAVGDEGGGEALGFVRHALAQPGRVLVPATGGSATVV
jgi:aminomethyltransferase